MNETEKTEEGKQEEQQPEGGAGFGQTIIHDHLVEVIRHPDNIRREQEQKEAARKAAEAAEKPDPEAA